MRTLVIAFEYPWPANSGSRLRLLTTVRALCRCGPTDLLSVVPTNRTDFDEPDASCGLSRVGRVPVRPATIVAGLAHPWLPAEIPIRDRRKVRQALAEFATDSYDLVWYFDARAWVLAGAPDLAPTVLDLIDLDDRKIRSRLQVSAMGRSALVDRWAHWPGRAWSRLEARRWTRLYRRASARTVRTVVCSQLDADRASSSGVKRVAVVPNTYPRPERPVGRDRVGSPPTVLFQGTLRYPPNADAARWLVDDIAPALRAAVPDVRIRLVGLGNPAQDAMHHPPALTVVGPIPDIVTELSQADVVVVPIRFGSGTRLKILEAFAHRIPVVSTTLGAEGLGAEDGRHLLVADTASGLAAACARVLTDPQLRHLVDAAHQLYLDEFRCELAEAQVAELAKAAEAAL